MPAPDDIHFIKDNEHRDLRVELPQQWRANHRAGDALTSSADKMLSKGQMGARRLTSKLCQDGKIFYKYYRKYWGLSKQ